MTPLLLVTVQKQGFVETEYLKNGEKLPAIVHMILAFVVKKESETITDTSIKHDAIFSQLNTNTSPSAAHIPVMWVVFLFIHDYGFKHWTFTHHKLYHPVNKE